MTYKFERGKNVSKIVVQEINDLDLAFGGNIKKMVPPMSEIPSVDYKWNKLFSDMFFCGIKIIKMTPKDGIDANKAMRHVRAVASSFDIKHEHKEAGCAYLLSEFFEDVQYERAERS